MPDTELKSWAVRIDLDVTAPDRRVAMRMVEEVLRTALAEPGQLAQILAGLRLQARSERDREEELHGRN